jgi:hypothetical protein
MLNYYVIGIVVAACDSNHHAKLPIIRQFWHSQRVTDEGSSMTTEGEKRPPCHSLKVKRDSRMHRLPLNENTFSFTPGRYRFLGIY